VVDGVLRQYAWYGSCPVWSSDNAARGPGVARFNGGGHPLTVIANVKPATAGWTPAKQLIEHVFLLMLENRSFDHMLGFSGLTGKDAETGRPTSVNGLLDGDWSNSYGGTTYPASKPADWVMPIDPGHEFTDVVVQLSGPNAKYPPKGPYPPIDDSGFVADYVTNGGLSPGEIMKCYAPEQLPVLMALAREFAVCDNWYCSMPGPTWPNRFFSLAATSGGLDHSPTISEIASWAVTGAAFRRGTIFDLIGTAKGAAGWRIYAGDLFPMSAFLRGVPYWQIRDYDKRFAADLASGDYPWAFTLIEPNYGDVLKNTYVGGTSQHPMDDVTRGERLIKTTYEAIRNSSVWNSSLLIVAWDEHGGFYDHTTPGTAPIPGDTKPGSSYNQYGFVFDQYGVRVPAVIASPLIPRNLIDHRLYDHTSVPATVERVFGLPPLTGRDKVAGSVARLATRTTPRTDCRKTLPDPAKSGQPDPRALAFEAGLQPLTEEEAPADVGNLPGILGVALRRDLAVDPEHQAETLARFRQIKTRGQARQYVDSVLTKNAVAMRAADPALPPGGSDGG
jgi:phospholipase C